MTDTLRARRDAARPSTTLDRVGPPSERVGASRRCSSEQAAPPPSVTWVRAGADRFVVLVDGSPVGFVDEVAPLFIALSGCRYDRAVEVAQCHLFDQCVAVLVARG